MSCDREDDCVGIELVRNLEATYAHSFLLVPVLLSAFACNDESSDDPGVRFTVVNDSDSFIAAIRFREADSADWGLNRLYWNLQPGEEFALLDVACGTYDAMAVDEDDYECHRYGVVLCDADVTWSITNDSCDVVGPLW